MTHLRLVDEPGADSDEDDPRADASVTLEPRGKRRSGGVTHWAIVEREGRGPQQAAAAKECRNGCPASVLVHDPRQPTNPVRVLCPKCAGDARRAML